MSSRSPGSCSNQVRRSRWSWRSRSGNWSCRRARRRKGPSAHSTRRPRPLAGWHSGPGTQNGHLKSKSEWVIIHYLERERKKEGKKEERKKIERKKNRFMGKYRPTKKSTSPKRKLFCYRLCFDIDQDAVIDQEAAMDQGILIFFTWNTASPQESDLASSYNLTKLIRWKWNEIFFGGFFNLSFFRKTCIFAWRANGHHFSF